MRRSNLTLRTSGSVFERGARQVIIEWSPTSADLLTVRLAGCRTRYTLPVDHIYSHAVRLSVEAKRREKRQQRKARRP